MKKILLITSVFSFPAILNAEEGHSHGIVGELEHAFPVIGILVAIMIIGVVYSYSSKKKQ